MGNGNTPMVSVCMITYNHEAYIRQAIEGVLMQKCNFSFEIIIGEDCSTDKTLEICTNLSEPNDPIRLLPTTSNLGMMPNFVRTLSECKGKYIALCEGDDYWTDPYKLQKQVDFLEKNEDFSICFHPVKIWQNGKIKADYLTRKVDDTTTILDLAQGNYIHTPSVVYRNKLFDQFPPEFAKSPAGDYFLHMLNARHGKIKKLPEIMGVYRLHNTNSWANTDFATMIPKWLKTLELLQNNFDDEVKQLLSIQYSNLTFELAIKLAAAEPIKAALYLKKSIDANSATVLEKIRVLNDSKDYKIGNFILRPIRNIYRLFRNFR